MNRRLVIMSVLLIILLVFCFFHVRGGELEGFASISEEYTAMVIKQPASLSEEEVQYSLNSRQTTALRDLFLETTFTRRLSNGFSYTGQKDEYVITMELTGADGKQLDFFHIFCVGSQYCQISAPYHDLNLSLNIHNPNWQDALERILSDDFS